MIGKQEIMEKIIEGLQKPTWMVGYPPSDLSELLDVRPLLELVRQVINNSTDSTMEYGILIKSKAAWTALKNAERYFASKDI